MSATDVKPTSSSSSTNEISSEQINILNSKDDGYGGVIADLKEPMIPLVFDTLLRASIVHWRQRGIEGVWLKLPIELVNLVETAVKQGFWYHHAEPTYLMLVYWIPRTAHTLPANASHTVGVGAFVMNDKREILVVQENKGRFKGTGLWKLPTGTINMGEDIRQAAIREVKEETRIDAEFLELLAVRQTHAVSFGKSDIFCVCMLRPLSLDIQKQHSEISAAKWMSFEEYAAQPKMQKDDHFKYIAKICSAKKDNDYEGFCALTSTAAASSRRPGPPSEGSVRTGVLKLHYSKTNREVSIIKEIRIMSGSSSSSSHEIDSQQMETLNASNDNYGGVKAEMKEPMDPTHFDNLLRASISHWRHEGEKGIWLKLPIKLSNLIHTAVKQGFWYHHAEPTYLMLVYWIPSTLHTLPANASQTVGVGACVINDKREILVVQENSGRFKDSDFWKLPTGMVKAGEDIRIAAVRELEEETVGTGLSLE